MAAFLYRLGRGAYRLRIAVVGAWVLILVAIGICAVTLSGSTVNSFNIPGQESTTALNLMVERFGSAANGASAQVVFQAPSGGKVTDAAVARRVNAVVAELAKLPGVAAASNPLDPRSPVVSADYQAAYSTVTYQKPAEQITAAQREALLGVLAAARRTGLTAEADGDAVDDSGANTGSSAEAGGVVVALIVLTVTYGSLIAAGMNLLSAIVGVGIGSLGITTLTGFMDLQASTPILALMLGLAVGIDYALFIVTRFRHELLDGRPVSDAVPTAVGTAGSAVVTAGLTVMIALAGLSVAGIPFLSEMGLAAAGTILVSVLVAITLVPAALGLIGLRALPRKARRRLGLPAITEANGERAAEPGRGFFLRWAHLVTERSWVTLALAVLALGVIAVPLASMRTSLNQNPDEGSTQAKATSIISAHFGEGFTGPLLVLVDGTNAQAAAVTVAAKAKALSGVALVAAPTLNAAKSAALVTVVPDSGPTSAATVTLVHRLRDALTNVTAARHYVTGTTAVSVDVSQKLNSALPVYLVLVVGLALILLILVFRSILVPVTGVLGFLLTIGATLGATTAVFQWGWLQTLINANAKGPLMSLLPLMVVGILFGLAMDYQVFLVSRMHEAHAHGRPPVTAVVTGFRQAAPVVVAAATIMFAVFAGFIPQGNSTIKPIAFALASGIVFDALVVRMIAMPSALALLRGGAWWFPSWLSWLPGLDVEGQAITLMDHARQASPRPARVSEQPPADERDVETPVGTELGESAEPDHAGVKIK